MKHLIFIIVYLSLNIGISKAADEGFKIDPASYSLGSLGAFAEMVDVGVKTLGLGTPMSTSDLDPLMTEANKIVARHNVSLYREADFLVTDLFPASVTTGMELLIVYKGDTLEKYMNLKTLKLKLLSKGQYRGLARQKIAFGMGALLSYPQDKIETLIMGNKGKEE